MLLTSLLPEGVMLSDADGNIVVLNQRFFSLYGVADVPTTWLGRCEDDLLQYVQAQWMEPAASTTADMGRRLGNEPDANKELITLRDGRTLACNVVLGERLGYAQSYRLLCLRDVSERRQLLAQMEAVSRIPHQNPYPLLQLTASGRQQYANEAAQELGRGVSGGAWANGQRRLRALAAQALALGIAQREEGQVEGRWFSVHVVPFVAEGYANLYLFETTARVQAEQKLMEQQRFYETILHELPAEVFVADPGYRYRFVNPAAMPDAEVRQWMIGRTNAEYSARRGYPATMMEKRHTQLTTVLEGRQRHEWVEDLGSADGPRYVMRRLQPVPEAGEAVGLVIGYGLDITAQETARRELREQQEFTQSILDASPSVIYVRNSEQKIIFENHAMQEVGKPPGTLATKRWRQIAWKPKKWPS